MPTKGEWKDAKSIVVLRRISMWKETMRQDELVVGSADGLVGIIEINRPEKFNSLSLRVEERLPEVIRGFEAAESGIRVCGKSCARQQG